MAHSQPVWPYSRPVKQPLGQVIGASGGSLDELLALVDVTFSNLVFIGLDREQLVNQCALIEGVLEAKPMLAIVALGDGMDNQLVLNAMRAGARDFVAYGSRSSEVAGLVRRLSKRLPPVTSNPHLGSLTVLYGTQCAADGALLTSHLARVVGQRKAREIWFLCRRYNAHQALAMGLVNEVVPLFQLQNEGVLWAREILQHSPTAIRCLKAAFNAETDGMAGLQELAGQATHLFYKTEEGKEGQQAFIEKRNPDFSQVPWL